MDRLAGATRRLPRRHSRTEQTQTQERASLEAKEPWPLRNGRWIVGTATALAALVGLSAVFILPNIDSLADYVSDAVRQRSIADLRRSGLALAAGIVAIAAGLLAWGRLELSRRVLQVDRKRYDNEHFARSIELLGNSDSSVRQGALYALEGLARSGYDPHTIYDIVSAYARSHAPEDCPDTTHDYEAAIKICARAPSALQLELDLSSTVIAGQTFDDLTRYTFDNATLTGCNFVDTTLSDCSFQRATIVSCSFRNAQIHDCNFNGAHIRRCAFSHSSFCDCKFMEDARLRRSEIVDSDFVRCLFIGASLARCYLTDTSLHRCNFSRASLRKIQFVRRGLSRCTFARATLESVIFDGTRITRCNVLANVLEGCSFDATEYDSNTQWPPGYTPLGGTLIP